MWTTGAAFPFLVLGAPGRRSYSPLSSLSYYRCSTSLPTTLLLFVPKLLVAHKFGNCRSDPDIVNTRVMVNADTRTNVPVTSRTVVPTNSQSFLAILQPVDKDTEPYAHVGSPMYIDHQGKPWKEIAGLPVLNFALIN